MNVKKEVLNSTGDGLTEDVRFNKAATDGAVFDDEGIYTVTVKNPNTGEEATTKRIYVGTDDVMKASVANNMTLSEVQMQIANGATVADDGTLKPAAKKADVTAEKSSDKSKSTTRMSYPVVVLFGVAAALIAAFAVMTRRKKTAADASDKPELTTSDEDSGGAMGGDER